MLCCLRVVAHTSFCYFTTTTMLLLGTLANKVVLYIAYRWTYLLCRYAEGRKRGETERDSTNLSRGLGLL